MHKLIPIQSKGKENNLQSVKTLTSLDEANALFQLAYQRINNPLRWHHLTGIVVTRFLLPEDTSLNHEPLISEGNYLRIEIPGPGTATGNGFDWIKIDTVVHDIDIERQKELFGMTFRACSNPEKNTDTTAHFFQSSSTSTFIIQRQQLTVTASYHGRNEIPNVHTESLLGNIRNAFVAVGAAAGLSETMWGILVKSFLKD